MRNKLRRFSRSFAIGFFVSLAIVYAASAQGSCPPGCKCHYVDNQFIVDCSGKATSVPPTGEPTDSPGATDEPGATREPRETPPNETPEPRPTNSSGTQFFDLHCVPLGAGDFGLSCPRNMYDIRSACGANLGCWIVYVRCADGCLSPTPKPGTGVGPLPCADVDFGGGGIQCTVAWDTRVSARIPPLPVGYLPFPRGIVYDAMQFNLPPLMVQGWQCSPPIDGWDPLAWAPSGNFRKLVFCLRWRQVKHPDPIPDPAPAWAQWTWDERPWGSPKGEFTLKREVNHTYVTSSAEKPTNGLNNLPSYQVQVRTYWIVEWKETWERREEICVHTGSAGDVCQGRLGMRKETRWLAEGRDGVADLREYGNGNFWASSTRIKTPWGADMNVLPVPVIEVQGVIEK